MTDDTTIVATGEPCRLCESDEWGRSPLEHGLVDKLECTTDDCRALRIGPFDQYDIEPVEGDGE